MSCCFPQNWVNLQNTISTKKVHTHHIIFANFFCNFGSLIQLWCLEITLKSVSLVASKAVCIFPYFYMLIYSFIIHRVWSGNICDHFYDYILMVYYNLLIKLTLFSVLVALLSYVIMSYIQIWGTGFSKVTMLGNFFYLLNLLKKFVHFMDSLSIYWDTWCVPLNLNLPFLLISPQNFFKGILFLLL